MASLTLGLGGMEIAGNIPGSNIPDLSPEQLEDRDRVKAIVQSYEASRWWSFRQPGYNPDNLIQNKGYDTMDDMLSVAAYASPLTIKKVAILFKEMEVKSRITDPEDPQFDQAKEIADFCDYALRSIENPLTGQVTDFRSILWLVLDACHIGFSVMEKVYRVLETGKYKGKLGLRTITPKRAKQIGFYLDPDTLELTRIRSYAPFKGFQTMPVEKALVYTYKPLYGLPYGYGDCRAAYKHVYSINEFLRNLGIAIEHFGVPFPSAKVSNTDPTYVQGVATAFDKARQGAALILPATIDEYEIHYAPNGSLDSIIKAIEFHETCITKLVLGQSLTTQTGDSSSGSYALGAVHQDTQNYVLSYVRKDIEALVTNQILRLLVKYNYGEEAMDVTPQFSLGVWDASERALLGDFTGGLVDRKILHPQDPQITRLIGLDPMPVALRQALDADHQAELDAMKKPEPAPVSSK